MDCVQKMLDDDGFKVKSERASAAIEVASKFLVWCQSVQNKGEVKEFSEWLLSSLRSCLTSHQRSFALRTEKMWEKFHALRTSKRYRERWDRLFEKATKQKATATVFQYITTRLFRQIIKINFELEKDVAAHCHNRLTREEENALRYVAGYVCRRVQKKIDKTSHTQKEDMMLLMLEFYGDSLDEDESEEWTNQIDRGGLWHVNSDTYILFTIIEHVIRNYLHMKALKDIDGRSKEAILNAILNNEELLVFWDMLTAHYGEEVPMEILRRISELYLINSQGIFIRQFLSRNSTTSHNFRNQKD